jgi:methylmalonyl-CoA/ethylmalonyl-CoA epimerase
MRKIEHIGIAVKDLQSANRVYTALLGQPPYKTEEVDSEGVRTSFFKVGEVKIELLEATRPDSPIAKFIEKRGEGVHHIAYDVESVPAAAARLKEAGFALINPEPKAGADDKLINFIHPKTTAGVLTEICQPK